MLKKLFFHFIEDLIRNISGPLGIKLRYFYYRKRLKSCGKKVYIETGVYISNPDMISIGNYVWIDKNVIFIAGKLDKKHIQHIGNRQLELGTIVIGNNIHIGINSILQGHGGIKIGDYFTSSADCKIYSMSNNVRKCRNGTFNNGQFPIHYICSPIIIAQNVWLGLGVSVLGGEIKKDSFVKPYSVVTTSIEENSIALGFPAQRLTHRFKEL